MVIKTAQRASPTQQSRCNAGPQPCCYPMRALQPPWRGLSNMSGQQAMASQFLPVISHGDCVSITIAYLHQLEQSHLAGHQERPTLCCTVQPCCPVSGALTADRINHNVHLQQTSHCVLVAWWFTSLQHPTADHIVRHEALSSFQACLHSQCVLWSCTA